MTDSTTLRARILDAANTILQAGGIRALTQPKVAAAAGIRQSHLQYYFPRKLDLILALLQGHTDMASGLETLGESLSLLASDPGRMRFFLGLIMEADEEPSLRALLDEHVRHFHALIADWYGRESGDPDVEAFANTLRGHGLLNLLRDDPTPVDIDALAARFGLLRK